ncbi:hypothetical protein LCGC14_1808760, partial [marine sediment metagenome]
MTWKNSTILTWLDWWGYYTHIVYSNPITGFFRMGLPDKTKVDLQIIFLGLDKP